MDFTHFNQEGRAKMVDVGEKPVTFREAIARGRVRMAEGTVRKVQRRELKKGDVLSIAQIAGIMAAKKTSEFIPMCHPLFLTGIDLLFTVQKEAIVIESVAKCEGKTGVEMEALTAVSAAALTIYDMCKAVDKEMVIEEIYLVKKTGGKSGNYIRRG